MEVWARRVTAGVERAAGLAHGPSARPLLRARRVLSFPRGPARTRVRSGRSAFEAFPNLRSQPRRQGHAETTGPFPSRTPLFCVGPRALTSPPVTGDVRVELLPVAMPTHSQRPSFYSWIPRGRWLASLPVTPVPVPGFTGLAARGVPASPGHRAPREQHGGSRSVSKAPALSDRGDVCPPQAPRTPQKGSPWGLERPHGEGRVGAGLTPTGGGRETGVLWPLSPVRVPGKDSPVCQRDTGDQRCGRAELGGHAGRGRGLTSVTLTTPICGADRSMSKVFSQ